MIPWKILLWDVFKSVFWALVAVCLILACIIFFVKPAHGATIELFQPIPQDQDIEYSTPGLKLTLGSGPYFVASYEKALIRFYGQEGLDLDLFGLGGGVKRGNFYIEVGYFYPTYSRRHPSDEAFYLALQHHFPMDLAGGPRQFYDRYDYALEGGFGGTIGVTVPISQRLSLVASYRVLDLHESIKGFWDGYDEGWHEHFGNRDLSSFQVGLKLTF